MVNFWTKSYSTSVYRTLGDKKNGSKCALALKFRYPWKPVRFCKCRHMAYVFTEGLRQGSVGYYVMKSWQISGSRSAQPPAKRNYREIQKSQSLPIKKMFTYLHLLISLRIQEIKSDFNSEKSWETIRISLSPHICSYFRNYLDFPCGHTQIFLKCWGRSQFLFKMIIPRTLNMFLVSVYNGFKGNEHNNIGKKELSTDFWSVYLTRDQEPRF